MNITQAREAKASILEALNNYGYFMVAVGLVPPKLGEEGYELVIMIQDDSSLDQMFLDVLQYYPEVPMSVKSIGIPITQGE